MAEKENQRRKVMRKFLLMVMVLTLVLTLGACKKVNAITWCFGPADCKSQSMYKMDTMGEPTELPQIAVLPTYTVGFNAIWLLDQRGLYSGPHMNVAKLFNLATIQGQYAIAIVSENETEEEGAPNYYGANVVVTISDLIRKFGGDPGEFILTFNPALGYTAGLKTDGEGFDHGPVINVVNADLERLCRMLGICKK